MTDAIDVSRYIDHIHACEEEFGVGSEGRVDLLTDRLSPEEIAEAEKAEMYQVVLSHSPESGYYLRFEVRAHDEEFSRSTFYDLTETQVIETLRLLKSHDVRLYDVMGETIH